MCPQTISTQRNTAGSSPQRTVCRITRREPTTPRSAASESGTDGVDALERPSHSRCSDTRMLPSHREQAPALSSQDRHASLCSFASESRRAAPFNPLRPKTHPPLLFLEWQWRAQDLRRQHPDSLLCRLPDVLLIREQKLEIIATWRLTYDRDSG